MYNKLQNFKEQGYILVIRLNREDAIETLKSVLDYFPKFDSSTGDESCYRKQFECFFHKLEKAYPNIFLMEMYGIQTLWNYIQCYRNESLNSNMGILRSAQYIHEIIFYLYQCLPNFVGLDEMPTYSIEKKLIKTSAGALVKARTKNEIARKIESGFLLGSDIYDGWDAHTIKKYYEDYKAELEREFALKNNTRCYFEEALLKKCEEEISKCNEGMAMSASSGIENIKEIFNIDSSQDRKTFN
ncbi:MAG: hypothetical protein IKU64_00785 [Bacteroides sp.]|nr:hypothetical protein [Bacteroides sp.]